MRKILFVVGPTASGKTGFALSLGKRLPVELINADSVQFYKELDIISGKDLPQEARFVKYKEKNGFDIGYYALSFTRIWLLDVVSPCSSFNVSDFVKIAQPLIYSILKRKKLPVVVGGSGLYIKMLLDPEENLDIPPDKKLRESLSIMSRDKLSKLLQENDPERFQKMNASDRKNKRRLIRAIEVSLYKSQNKDYKNSLPGLNGLDVLLLGLKLPIEVLKEKIKKRVEERIKAGALQEARKLFSNYSLLCDQVKNANGYKELFDYLLGKTSIEDAIARWEKAEIENAKKQMVFFKKDKRINWFDSRNEGIFDFVLNWYNEK